MRPMLLLAPALTTFLLFAVTIAALVNVTIDDELGDSRSKLVPQYAPSGKWAQGGQCSGCALHPGIVDVAQTVDQTWHDGTYHPGQPDQVISLTFTGVAIYVFNIVPNSVVQVDVTTLTNLSFFLDHEYVGQFLHLPDRSTDIAYHVPVYVNDSLLDMQHSLDIRATGPNASLVLFDYAVYSSTTDDSNSTSSSSTFTPSSSSTPSSSTLTPSSALTPTPSSTLTSSPSTSAKRGRIIGGVVGSMGGFIAVLVLVFFYCRRSRKRRRETQDAEVVKITDANPVYIPMLRSAGDMFRPRPYPPPSNSVTVLSAIGAAMTGADGKGHDTFDTDTWDDVSLQPPRNTLPSLPVAGQLNLNILEDLATMRQEIARIEQIIHPTDSLPPPYSAEGYERQ